ncbi:MAG TPA: hypothetical protein PKV50_08415 [Prolixibacteraceae bacterium]|jgi:hypothetical protein|nr:hypothetical protein [Prolixibacteraceae bacterium]
MKTWPLGLIPNRMASTLKIVFPQPENMSVSGVRKNFALPPSCQNDPLAKAYPKLLLCEKSRVLEEGGNMLII